MRISRPCFNKMHRCPGWAGGGTMNAKVQRCSNGYITYYTTEYGGTRVKRAWKWRLNRCPECRVVILPYMVRYLDWRYLVHWELAYLPGRFRDWRWERDYRHRH